MPSRIRRKLTVGAQRHVSRAQMSYPYPCCSFNARTHGYIARSELCAKAHQRSKGCPQSRHFLSTRQIPPRSCPRQCSSSLSSQLQAITKSCSRRYVQNVQYAKLGRRILLDDSAHLLVVRCSVFLEEVERISLRRRFWIRLVEQ